MRVVTGMMAGFALFMAGCASLPRGAALQTEVLAGAAAAGDTDAGASASPDTAADDIIAATASFAVETVTRDRLAAYVGWPAVGEAGLPWINRVEQPNNRIIAPGDTVVLTIWNTEENGLLTTPGQRFVTLPPMRVTPGGEVFLPYIGGQRIAGMAPETARARIEERYLEVTPSAQVQLELAAGRLNTVSVVGGVAGPGVLPLVDQNVTILDMLAQAGGIAAGLVNPQVRLQRDGRLYGISADRLLADPGLNTTLQGGDRIHVEADERYFLSLGAAGREAQHRFAQDRVTALDALAIIGGVSDDRADPQGILVLRRYPESAVRRDGTGPAHARTIFTLDLTSADGLFSAGQFQIRAGDLVYVTESPLIGARTILGLIGTTFGLVNQVTN